jgi:hypothetical protein
MDIIFDIDGTLMDISHRKHFVDGVFGDKKDWQAFKNATIKDTPIDMICTMAIMLHADMNRIILVSGRNESERWITEKQMEASGIIYDTLVMRPNDDYDPDHILKSRILDALIDEGYDPKMVFDDRAAVVKMWRDRGLTCLQVAEGNF